MKRHLHLRAVRRALPWCIAAAFACGGLAHAQTREDAVRLAREGRYQEAIAMLEGLRARGGGRAVGDDLAVVLAWAGRPADALAAFTAAGPTRDAPGYARSAMIQAARDTRRFAEAQRLAREGMALEPASREWPRLLALSLADDGRGKAALDVLDPLLKADPDDAGAWLARGYAASRAGDPYAALRAYGEARRLHPDDRGVASGVARVLRDWRAPNGTAAALPPAPLPLQAEQAGSKLRWGTQVVPRDPKLRFAGIDAALEQIDKLIVAARAANDADTLARLRRDRALALRQRERWADALAEIDAMRADGIALPPFVRQAEADSLLALRRPREARPIYVEVLGADPSNRDAHVALVFACVEDEDFDAAFAAADTLAAMGRPFRQSERDPTPEPDMDWLDAQILAAMVRNYADMNAEAWRRIDPLATGAPALGYLRSANGSVAAARVWPRRADDEVRTALSLAPEDRGIQAAVADSAMRRREWPEARERIGGLAALYPEDAEVQRLVRDLRAHDMYELRAGFSGRRETGNASGAPGNGLDFNARLYSPPIAERWRAIAAYDYLTAKPIEGRVIRQRVGIGAEWRSPDVTVEAIGWTNWDAVDKGGATLAATWAPTDHWMLTADGEIFSLDTPLRAQWYGITANAVGASAGYAWHESRSMFLGVRGLDFSDGNQRRIARFAFAERVVDRPHLDVTLRPELYASSNTRTDAPYFNPLSDRSAALSVDIEHVIWRFYDQRFGQRLVLTGGAYWQENFGTGAIGAARYEQVWRSDPSTEVRYGVEVNRRLYDGVGENALVLFANLVQRF